MTAALVGWLRATHAEAERIARDVERVVGPERAGEPYTDGSGIASNDAFPSYPWGQEDVELKFMRSAGHPSAVLARVEAERLLLADHEPEEWDYLDDETWDTVVALYCRRCAQGESCGCCLYHEDRVWPCPVWRTIAYGWRHMPGWQDRWTPERTQ